MRAYTISKLLTTRNINTNVPDVLARFDCNLAIEEANHFLLSVEKKKAVEVFKNVVSEDKIKAGDVEMLRIRRFWLSYRCKHA